jgi:hypothetical protein
MVRLKLEGVQPLKTMGRGLTAAATGATGLLNEGASAVGGRAAAGVFSLGRGFRDFILRGTVVELAVAVVLGTAFTNLVASATAVRVQCDVWGGGHCWTRRQAHQSRAGLAATRLQCGLGTARHTTWCGVSCCVQRRHMCPRLQTPCCRCCRRTSSRR